MIIDTLYWSCIEDLCQHPKVQMMKNYKHHKELSCLEHSLRVSYLSFIICRSLKLDYCAAARGGLLHDFFLYEWQTQKCELGLHGFYHPQIALKNAKKYFQVSALEKDIIVKHMFPLTLLPPKYKESMVICMVDKYCATEEYVRCLKKPFQFQ